MFLGLLTACAVDDTGPSADDGFDDVTTDDSKADLGGPSVRIVHTFSDPRLYPEGGAYDPVELAFYVGSLQHGTITRVGPDGRESLFHPGTADGRYTLGMQVDAARRLLWVCSTKDSRGRIWALELATGATRVDVDLTTIQPEGACNDVLVDSDGSVLVSDRENPYIYRVDLAGHVTVWAHHPLLAGAIVGLNSMVFTPDRRALLTAVYLPPRLVRVDVANPGDVREVELSGARFMDGFNLLNGPDDLIMDGDTLVVAFGSSIKRITPGDPARWVSGTVTSSRSIGGVTALVRDDSQIYGINGQSVRFLLGVRPAPFKIYALP